jgi:hypothetical protein
LSNIRNRTRVAERLAEWGPFNACFVRNARLSDLDGAVELGGQILIVESKPYKWEWGKGGQRKLLESLARIGCTVVVIYCDDIETWTGPLAYEVVAGGRWPGGKERHDTTLESVRRRFHYWAKWAEHSPLLRPDKEYDLEPLEVVRDGAA